MYAYTYEQGPRPNILLLLRIIESALINCWEILKLIFLFFHKLTSSSSLSLGKSFNRKHEFYNRLIKFYLLEVCIGMLAGFKNSLFNLSWKPKKDIVRIYIPGDICPHNVRTMSAHHLTKDICLTMKKKYIPRGCCADIVLRYISRDIYPHYILLGFQFMLSVYSITLYI